MLNRIKLDRRSDVEKLFDEQLEVQLKDAESLEDIGDVLSMMERRNELRNKRRISPDTIAIVACNLLGIILILEHERSHVIASKALGFIIRGRV
ncbi:MAG: hypothetical protein PHQ86_04525 [Dehalococcoidales bacterium]|nr:hypothetical protein [Dehalococcoidales bacterium]